MAEQKGTQSVPIDTTRVISFSGGMNTSVGGSDIADNECILIQNMEFDDADDLVQRQGFPTVIGPGPNRITSLYSFVTDAGFIGILSTQASALLSRTLAGVSTVLIAGGGALPNDVRWFWKTLDGVAVGVNGSIGAGNPIQVVGPAPGVATHLAAAPDGRYIEEWNSRLFIVHAANPNTVQCSDLGSATVWNTDGLTNPAHGITFDIAKNDGDRITGLFATKERLFIFKRNKIYVLRTTAIPNTDPNNWEVAEYSKNIGSLCQSTIRSVFDDVVFLSEGGLCSLAAAEITADFESALISQKIAAIQRIKKTVTEDGITSFTLNDKSQYWLAVNSAFTESGNSETYILDYKRIKQGIIRWTMNTGIAVPTAIELHKVAQAQNIYLMGINQSVGQFSIAQYIPNTPPALRTFTDNNATITASIVTKSYDFSYKDIRKLILKWYLGVRVDSTSLTVRVLYAFDNANTTIGSGYSFALVPGTNAEKLIRRSLIQGLQRKGLSIRFIIQNGVFNNQGLAIKNFGIKFGLLNEDRAETN